MGHAHVTRVSIGLVLLLSAASLAFAWRARQPGGREMPTGAPLDGERLFALHCAACHAPEEWAERFRGGAEVDVAAAEMLAYLADHGDASADEDRAIVASLRALAAE